MSTVVYKYPLGVTDVQTIQMPQGARVLCVQMQNGGPCLWALVDKSKPMQGRRFRVVGTGHTHDDLSKGLYVGTFQVAEYQTNLVFHVFDVTNQEPA